MDYAYVRKCLNMIRHWEELLKKTIAEGEVQEQIEKEKKDDENRRRTV